MINPLGDWYLVTEEEDISEGVILACPDTSHFVEVGDRVVVFSFHAHHTKDGRFIHRNDILGAVRGK